MVDFIGVYDKVTRPSMCKEIIDFFENNKDLQFRGRYLIDGEPVRDPSVKDSKDISLNFDDDTIPSIIIAKILNTCLLYTSPSPRDRQKSRMPSSA